MSVGTKTDLLMKEIELDLQAIEEKYKLCSRVKYPNSELTKSLLKLSEELDSLGLPKLDIIDPTNKQMLKDLISNMFVLIHMHRKSVKEINDACLSRTQTDMQKCDLKKDIETYENTVKRKDAQIKSLNWRIENLQFINKELEEKNRKLQAELKLMKTAYNSNKKEYDHKLSNQKVEMHSLKEKCGLTAGRFISKDTVILEHLNKYKANEEIHEHMISKLQRNNEQLLIEVVNLREELVQALLEKRQYANNDA